MERITSKLARVLVITLLTAATMVIAALPLKASTGVTQNETTHPAFFFYPCPEARAARARNMPDASLENQCLNVLAARGEKLANEDPEIAKLANQQTNPSTLRGFRFGLAMWEGE